MQIIMFGYFLGMLSDMSWNSGRGVRWHLAWGLLACHRGLNLDRLDEYVI